MYTIEYRGEHQHKKPNITSSIHGTCKNIKSITIDLEDVKYFGSSDCEGSYYLGGFVNRVQRLDRNSQEYTDHIRIPNDNPINEMCIYAIINCDWMVSSEDTDYEELLNETADELIELEKRLNVTTEAKEITRIQRRIKVLEYRVHVLNDKRRNGVKSVGRTLVISNRPAKKGANH